MLKFIPLVLLVLAIACVVEGQAKIFGDDGPRVNVPSQPRSPAVVEAKRKYDLSLKIAQDAYQKSVIAADAKYADDLSDALHAAMKAEDVTNVELIHKAMQDATEAAKQRKQSAAPDSPEKALDWLGGTQWNYLGTVISYRADHKMTCSAWSGERRWEAVDATSINQYEAEEPIHITFSADKKYALWVYPHGRDVQIGRRKE